MTTPITIVIVTIIILLLLVDLIAAGYIIHLKKRIADLDSKLADKERALDHWTNRYSPWEFAQGKNPHIRRSGATTRIADLAIYEFFEKGEATLRDHDDPNGHRSNGSKHLLSIFTWRLKNHNINESAVEVVRDGNGFIVRHKFHKR